MLKRLTFYCIYSWSKRRVNLDREQRRFLALREMDINVDDSMQLTKFIQQETARPEDAR